MALVKAILQIWSSILFLLHGLAPLFKLPSTIKTMLDKVLHTAH